MSQSLLIAFVMFATVMFFTPGPNNMMLLASGANFGLRRTVPHKIGITGGLTFMALVLGLGLAGMFRAYPALETALELPREAVRLTWESLARVGNLSSASVLHVLEDTLRERPPAASH